jgi:hypothetical protein
VLVGLWANESSSFKGLLGSMPGLIEGLDLVVASEVLDAFSESLLGRVAVEELESREGGSTSGKAAVDGDCNLDDGPDTTTGEDTVVAPGLSGTGLSFVATLFAPVLVLSPPSTICSFAPPTEALKRLYRPLRPLDTNSTPRGSSARGAGGAVRSSNVVSVSEREAVACSWWSDPGSEVRDESAMAGGGAGCLMCRRRC